MRNCLTLLAVDPCIRQHHLSEAQGAQVPNLAAPCNHLGIAGAHLPDNKILNLVVLLLLPTGTDCCYLMPISAPEANEALPEVKPLCRSAASLSYTLKYPYELCSGECGTLTITESAARPLGPRFSFIALNPQKPESHNPAILIPNAFCLRLFQILMGF